MLKLDLERIASLRALLDDLQYDAVQCSLRADYFFPPFPAPENCQQSIAKLSEHQKVSYEVLLLGQVARQEYLERLWGAERAEHLLEVSLLLEDIRGNVP